MGTLFTLAAEGGHIGPDSIWADVSVPLGILIFVGPVYLLLRSNLGTRLGYLVMATSLWGSTFLLALFWTFGAPGTPAFTGPQNLPGQELDAYTPVWVPLAQDSPVATEVGSDYEIVESYPAGWSDEQNITDDELVNGQSEIMNVFRDITALGFAANPLDGTEEIVATQFATADNGRPIIAVTYAATCQLERQADPDNEGEFIQALPPACEGMDVGAVAPEGSDARGADLTLFAFFDAGNPGFPSYLMLIGTFVLFALHMVLLARDESRTAEEQAEEAADAEVPAEDEEQQPVPA